MKISNSEKLILYMLAEIYDRLKIEDGVDAGFVREAIETDNVWAIEMTFTGIFGDSEDELPEDVKETFAILAMWSSLETAYGNLSPHDQDRVKSEAVYGPIFKGFDGNNETRYLSIADFIVDHMDRFREFKGRDLNSHAESLSHYRHMLPKFKSHQRTAEHISADAIVEILTTP